VLAPVVVAPRLLSVPANSRRLGSASDRAHETAEPAETDDDRRASALSRPRPGRRSGRRFDRRRSGERPRRGVTPARCAPVRRGTAAQMMPRKLSLRGRALSTKGLTRPRVVLPRSAGRGRRSRCAPPA